MARQKLSVEQLLPLTPRMFHILLAISDGARHGYAIMEEVEACSDGRVRVGPGTLYEALQSLEKKGLVEPAPPPRARHDDPRRRYHRLTTLGVRVLGAEAKRLEDLVRVVRSKNLNPDRLKSV